MACKSPGGSKKKYIYYQCNKCKTFIREDILVNLLLEEISSIIDYDLNVRKFFAPLLKHKIEYSNELLEKEKNDLKNKLIRLKDAYLNNIIDLEEYNTDKKHIESKIVDIEEKQTKEKELEQYNFTFEDLMLKRDLESIKSIANPFYKSIFEMKWNELSINEKQELITSYIDSIEVIKKGKNVEIKQLNFRKTFIEEYANIFNKGGINKYQNILINGEEIQIEICKPMKRQEIKKYIKSLQANCPIDYHEVPKEQVSDTKFTLKYKRDNKFLEPFKLIPIQNDKDTNKITHYGIVEIFIQPINIINIIK